VTDEIDSVRLQRILGVEFSHGHLVEIVAIVSLGVLGLVFLGEEEELGATTLLEETHKAALESLTLIRRHLVDLATAVHVRATDALELEVAGDVGVKKSLDELAHAHDELGDDINVVVTRGTKGGFGSLAGLVLLVKLIELERGAGATVVAVAIEVENLEAVHREQTAQDALLEASAHNDNIIVFLHLNLILLCLQKQTRKKTRPKKKVNHSLKKKNLIKSMIRKFFLLCLYYFS